MSMSGSKIREQVAHFLVDIHNGGGRETSFHISPNMLRKGIRPFQNVCTKSGKGIGCGRVHTDKGIKLATTEAQCIQFHK